MSAERKTEETFKIPSLPFNLKSVEPAAQSTRKAVRDSMFNNLLNNEAAFT